MRHSQSARASHLKAEIGKSLSNFYKVPFVDYNQNAPIPGELLSGLKVPFMKSNYFVPLRVDDGKVVVATDNPNDLQKADSIKMLFPGKPVGWYWTNSISFSGTPAR